MDFMQGLYRTAMQKKQAEFLARDFTQVKNQEAACKNAFVLLGQHKYEMAAAFFLLGMIKESPMFSIEDMEARWGTRNSHSTCLQFYRGSICLVIL